jgi:beta-lactamase class A
VTLPFGRSISYQVVDAGTGEVFGSSTPDRVHRTASIGKVLLLIEVAVRFADGRLRPDDLLARTEADTVADSGLWQHLLADELPAADVAALVGSVSDNLAANVLLRTVGLLAVTERARTLELSHTRLHDRVRAVRRPSDPETLSTGTAAELAGLMAPLHRGEVRSKVVSRQVLRWLALDTDTSMVAGALGLDPLAHIESDRGLALAHKTGTDTGIRCDIGVVTGPRRSVAYAVLAEFDDDDRDAVLGELFTHGQRIRELAEN